MDDRNGPGRAAVLSLLVDSSRAPTRWCGSGPTVTDCTASPPAGGLTSAHPPRCPATACSACTVPGTALWVGTEGGVAHLVGGRWRRYTRDQGLPADTIASITESQGPDGSRTLWLGTQGGGLVRFDGHTWTTLGLQAGLPSSYVYSLLPVGGPPEPAFCWWEHSPGSPASSSASGSPSTRARACRTTR